MDDPRIAQAFASGRIPPGITPEMMEENRDTEGIVSIVIITSLASLVVICRLLLRRFIVKAFGLGLDDGIVLASLLTFIPFSALCIYLISIGAGRKPIFLNFAVDYEQWQYLQVVDSIAHLTYSTALLLCRISGLAFYYRICALHKEFLRAITVIFAIIILGYLVQILLIIFHCNPVTMVWIIWGHECIPWDEVYTIISSISLACDFLLFGLPAAMLKALEMSRKQKVQLACILLPGIAVVGISASRIALVIFYGREGDGPFNYSFLGLLCVEVSEISATLIALSIPGVKPLVDKYMMRKDSSSGGPNVPPKKRGSIGSQSSGLSASEK